MSQTPSWRQAEVLLPPSATLPPKYQPERLARLDIEALVDLIVAAEDRVPRIVVDECADRGAPMVERLCELVARGYDWNARVNDHAWWLRLHAVMILGLMASEAAGRALVAFMRRMGESEDEALQEWLSGYWPALHRNKPPAIVPLLREVALERGHGWFMRTEALECVVAAAEREGRQALEGALDWVAGLARDDAEDVDFRISASHVLLDFPRPRHRAQLLALVQRQPRTDADLRMDDVTEAYARGRDDPQWQRFRDPWDFYEPQAIAERQARWDQEAREAAAEAASLPYERESLKVGRNDPCPCGSGKKYKRCCMDKPLQ